MTQKIVINQCFGGFGLSLDGLDAYNERRSNQPETDYDWEIPRDDPDLVWVVENIKNCSGRCSSLRIVEVPNDVDWVIKDYDGNEWVAEKHRTWGD